MRLTFRLVMRLQDALRLVLIARLETGLLTGGFVFEVENAPRAADQTECLFHRFTHVAECVRSGVPRVSEQWTSYSRAVTNF